MKVSSAIEHGLLGLIADRVASRDTGVITATHGKQRRLFCLRRGTLIYAISNVIEEQFGSTLVRRKLLSSDAVAQAEVMAAERQQRLGAWLLTQGSPSAKQLVAAMADHVRWLLASTLLWPKGDYAFEQGQAKVDDEPTAELDGAALVLELAAGLQIGGSDLRMRIGPPDFRPTVADKRKTLVETGAPGPLVTFLLACDGSRDVSALLEASPAPADETLRVLYALRLLRVVSARKQQIIQKADGAVTRAECIGVFEHVSGADHYGVLGLTQTCTTAQVRDAYYYLARRFHPDRFRTGELRDLLDRAEEFFTRVTEAYNTLYDPERRAEYDKQAAERVGRTERTPETDANYLARQNYLRGKALIEGRRFQEAVRFLENAVQQDGSSAAYQLELGRVLIRNPRRRDDAERHLLAALERDPTLIEAYRSLGELFEKLGRVEEAVDRYREVLRWDPNDAEAQARLREMGDEGEGGLRRWLR